MPQNSTSLLVSLTGRYFYTIYAITTTMIILPYHLLICIFPSFRPHAEWTYHQSVMNYLMGAFLYHASALEVQTPLPLSPGSEGSNFAAIHPAQASLYRGAIAPTKAISPGDIGGVWYPAQFDPEIDSEGMIFLYFHGGAFVIGTARPDVCSFAASTLTRAFPRSKTLAFSYRLASKDSSCAFPAALQDALSAYVYLLDRGITAQQIVFAGDSAGCNLAIGLLRYLASPDGRAMQLPEPRAAIFCSPWVDVYATRGSITTFMSRYHRTRTDYVPAELQSWGARTYVPAFKTSASDAYISPFHCPFLTSTTLSVLIGGGEVLAGEGAEWAREMEGVGCKVRVEVTPLANHAILGVGGLMDWKGEAERAVRRAKEWILDEK